MLLLRNRSVMSLALLKWLPDEKKIDSYGMMNKQRRAFYFLLFSLCYIIAPPGNLGVIWQGIFLGVIFGPGIFLGNVGRLRDFFGSWVLPPFDHPRHLQAGVPPPGVGTRALKNIERWCGERSSLQMQRYLGVSFHSVCVHRLQKEGGSWLVQDSRIFSSRAL